ncbi:MAG: ABC-F family ATP-binding cassette domain-containing protein, partial [Vallitaleaceae bacterium]|nr:ABC-F family ATP-binding cassette domain-containing protein [Vallitaleaceae bacterium]
AAMEAQQRSSEFKRAPSRMGNSESRLHRRAAGERRAKVEKTKVNLQARAEKLEVKEKPFVMKEVQIKVPIDLKLYTKNLIQGQQVEKSYGSKCLFKDSNFIVENNKKTVLLGANGSGKTTLVNMICQESEGILKASKLKIGYFRQNLDNLKEELTVFENVLETTTRSESEVRNILANFLFKKEDVHKKVGVLSGGERIKASFAKVFLSDMNFLILDEPTNYLDLNTKKSLEEALLHYEGPVLIVSHDRYFVGQLAEAILFIEDEEIKTFGGNFEAFLNRKTVKNNNQDNAVALMLLQNRMNYVLGRISAPAKGDVVEKLEVEYAEILKEIKVITSN